MISKETLANIVKCVVAFNGQQIDFDKKFLELYNDNVELELEDMGDSIRLKTKMKGDKHE